MPPPEQAPLAGQVNDGALQFENFNKEWRQTSDQDNFDGFRMEMSSPVSKFMQTSHTLFLGTQMRETGYIYQFGPSFQSESGKTVLVARVGLDGGVNGRWIQRLGNAFELKASSQSHLTDPNRNMHDASLEYNGSSWTCGAKAAWQGAMLLGGSFTKRIMPSLQLGGDATCVMVQQPMLIGTAGFRWASGQNILTGAVTRQPDMRSPVPRNNHEMRLQYTRRLSERLCLGTEFKYSHPEKESGLSMAYEYTFRTARIQGLVDTAGRVSCSVFDHQGMGFSGVIDYMRSDYKFGVMMQITPPEAQPPQ